MTDHDDVLHRIDEAAAVSERQAADGQVPPGIAEARAHLNEAWGISGAGTEIPPDARLRQVKKALVTVARPVTSFQVPFNREVVVAVDQLALVVADLIERLETTEERTRAATSRIQAALATTDLAVDDLTDRNQVGADLEELRSRLERAEHLLAEQNAALRAMRSRQDLVLRTARDALATVAGGAEADLSPLAVELADGADALAAELADLTLGARDDVLADRRAWVADLATIPAGGPVVDLGAGRGEWLEILAEQGVTAWGVETNRHLAEAARARGADIRDGDPVGHLAGLEESTVGAVTAFGVVDHLGPEAVVALVDAALVALRPGGVLIVEVPNVTALDVGAAGVWTDPARRPIHPEFLEFLMVARGYAEVELRWRHPVDEALWVQADDLAGPDATRAQAVADRFNRLLAGPRVVAVIARKAGAPPS